MKKLTSSEIISKLRAAGYRVQIRHDRAYREVWVNASSTCKVLELQLSPNGGNTVVCVTDQNGNITCGIAGCNASDSYCKKRGVEIAVGRAVKALGLKRRIHSLPEQAKLQATGVGRLSLSCYPDYKEELEKLNVELRNH